MRNVAINFIWLLAAFGVFAMLSFILAQRIEMPTWVPFDYHDGPWLWALLKMFGVVAIMPPFAATLGALFSLGGEPSRYALWSDMQKNSWSLQLSKGVKWTMVGLAMTLAGGIVFALWVQQEPLGIWLFASPLLLFSFYVGLVFLIIKISFDQTHITAMTPFLRWQTHEWADLVQIEYVSSWTELRLHFSDGRFARVSDYLHGSMDILEFAKAKLKDNGVIKEDGDTSPSDRDGLGLDE